MPQYNKLADAVRTLRPAPGLDAGATQGSLIDDRAVRSGRAHQRCARERRPGEDYGQRRVRRPLLRTDGARRRHAVYGDCTRGDVRSGGAAVPLPYRRGSDRGQRHALRPCRVFPLRPRRRARLAGGPRRSSRAWSASIPGSSRPRWRHFGGGRESGLGREGSKYGIEEFLEVSFTSVSAESEYRCLRNRPLEK